MGILPLLVVAFATGSQSIADHSVIKIFGAKHRPFVTKAIVSAQCIDQKSIITQQSFVDVILAIDTSSNNHRHIDEIKDTAYE